MNTNTLVQIAIGIIAFILIFKYLLPLLPPPIGTIIMIVLIVLAIVWLLRIVGLIK